MSSLNKRDPNDQKNQTQEQNETNVYNKDESLQRNL